MTRLPHMLLALLPAAVLLTPAPSAAQTVINFDDTSSLRGTNTRPS